MNLLDPSEGERVLDVGSGTGEALVSLSDSVGHAGHAVGVDIAEGMCRTARTSIRTAGVGDRAEVVCADATRLPLRDGSMDAIFSSFTLELFDTPDIPVVLRECRRILRPGGRLCVVSLSKRRAGLATGVYERLHTLFPRHLDCRPIFVREAVRDVGFRVQSAEDEEMWGLSIELVLARAS
ncbi:class I SAM-dependent methyltransferase [Halomicrococcus sp. SG-WS-1]|uniref:class I SAM-dependent methyltransferase n=1 Tax=Halomicrococcus sp. SG-WS-1 TaxID=3439057 RepID=UPI003F79639D